MSQLVDPPLDVLLAGLADKATRIEAARTLARAIGAEAFIVLLRDEDLGIMRPAPGFPRTLPGGPGWRDLLRRAADPGEFEIQVASPSGGGAQLARVTAMADGTAIVVVGGPPSIAVRELARAFQLPGALFRAEAAVEAAEAAVRASNEVAHRSKTLAWALDQARSQVSANASALQQALKDAAGLNAELRELNETLERRVQEEIASRLKTEEALRQGQKMEAVGQLTGGIAHDFNNMLAIVIGSLDLAARRLERGQGGAERYLENAREGAARAASLTQRLLAFSRQQPLSPRVLNLNRLVSEMSELLRRTLGETIELETVLGGGIWPANVDPHQLESALVNLAVNARDAMTKGGRLTIETANTHLDESYARQHLGLKAGQYVMIAVTDGGAGMSREVLDRVFDPFFTTKPVGKGTGLGLSMVYGFVKQSGGHVAIYSELDQGTTVKIYLPRHLGSAVENGYALKSAPLSTEGGTEVVLVVEDEERVRLMSAEALQELGYSVFQASSGDEALRIIETLPRLDLLFTDVVMAGMTGRQLADKVRQQVPEVEVLYTTGYTRNAVVHNGVLDPGVDFVAKPFSIAELATKVRAVLDRKMTR